MEQFGESRVFLWNLKQFPCQRLLWFFFWSIGFCGYKEKKKFSVFGGSKEAYVLQKCAV